jgi:hypothetical protein
MPFFLLANLGVRRALHDSILMPRAAGMVGGSPSLYELFPEKPPGMWERTYRKLRELGLQAETRYCGPL